MWGHLRTNGFGNELQQSQRTKCLQYLAVIYMTWMTMFEKKMIATDNCCNRNYIEHNSGYKDENELFRARIFVIDKIRPFFDNLSNIWVVFEKSRWYYSSALLTHRYRRHRCLWPFSALSEIVTWYASCEINAKPTDKNGSKRRHERELTTIKYGKCVADF